MAGTQERMTGLNKYFCDSCNRLTEAVRRIRFEALPPILTIHLNRSSMEGSGKVQSGIFPTLTCPQIRHQVPCPFSIALARWCTDTCAYKDVSLDLIAIVFHSGASSFSGHYTVFVRKSFVDGSQTGKDVQGAANDEDMQGIDDSSQRKDWIKFDDSTVTYWSHQKIADLMSPLSQLTSTAFMLLYKRKE